MSDAYPLPLTRAEAAGEKPPRLVRAAARIAILAQHGKERKCLFVRHQIKGLELPGGAIDPGEVALQAALRELSEEAGVLLPTNHRILLITMIPITDNRGGNWLDIVYGTVVDPAQLTVQPDAELPVLWLETQEIQHQIDQQISSYKAALAAVEALAAWTG